MSLRAALVARLVAADTPAGDRVSWYGRARGDPLPAIVLLKVTPGEEWTHDGPDGLDRPRVRVDCYADSDVGAEALAEAVKTELHGAATVEGVRFHPAMLDGDRDFDDSEQDGGEALFRTQLEFLFYHEET